VTTSRSIGDIGAQRTISSMPPMLVLRPRSSSSSSPLPATFAWKLMPRAPTSATLVHRPAGSDGSRTLIVSSS
jgi:hypothetical protein